ncbi:hypothetical protein Syun_017891 [Stephania yunnanensis]|uniref:Uncharacterized protein n=1 Tax=Stephania yunnanensis TaxID=152371 RepID=A0AAP0J7Z9_9MAGN
MSMKAQGTPENDVSIQQSPWHPKVSGSFLRPSTIYFPLPTVLSKATIAWSFAPLGSNTRPKGGSAGGDARGSAGLIRRSPGCHGLYNVYPM